MCDDFFLCFYIPTRQIVEIMLRFETSVSFLVGKVNLVRNLKNIPVFFKSDEKTKKN